MAFDRGWAFGGILPAWSLSVEVSFYILLPLFVWLVHARLARRRAERSSATRRCSWAR